MKHRPFVLGRTLAFAMVVCSGSDDDVTTSTRGQISEVATTTPGHKEGEP